LSQRRVAGPEDCGRSERESAPVILDWSCCQPAGPSAPNQDSRRPMLLGMADAAVLRLATAVGAETPHVGGEVAEEAIGDLGASGQVLQAIGPDDARRVICQNVSDPSLLGA
jgi:hypothetical protein